jgi:hypothetical protein
MLIIDINAGTGGLGILYRVDPYTGERTVLSDFGVGANQGSNPVGVAVYPVIHAPVGGYVVPSNKLAVLAPYIVLAGLIAAVSAVYVIKRRKN